MPRVALVNMPFANPRWPSLGLGLLKAGLARQGIACDVMYLNLDFAEQIGLDDYLWLADSFGFVLGGERLFAKHFFGGRKKGTGPICRNGPEGASHKLDLSPSSRGSRESI